jgi:hypothetical protein
MSLVLDGIGLKLGAETIVDIISPTWTATANPSKKV